MPQDEDDFDDRRPRRARRRDDGDDFDDDDRGPRRQPRGESGGSTATKVLLIICGTLVVIVGTCVGSVFLFINSCNKKIDDSVKGFQKQIEDDKKKRDELETNSDYGRARTFANEMLQNIKGKRFEALQKAGTASFQKEWTKEKFDSLIEKISKPLGNSTEVENDIFAKKELAMSVVVFKVRLVFHKDPEAISLTVVKENDQWKLDKINEEK